jgi:hypothetical protein
MLTMYECVLQAQKMMVIVFVEFLIEQVEHRHLHHTLIEVGRPILDHFDGHNFLRPQVLAFDHLAEGALA